MKKFFKTAEAGGKSFLLPDTTVEGFTEKFGKDAHIKAFRLKAFPSMDFTARLTAEDKKNKVAGITNDPIRVLPYFNEVAVAIVGKTKAFSEKYVKAIQELYLPACLELAAADTVEFLAGFCVDKDGKPLSADVLDQRLGAYLEKAAEADRAKVVVDIYTDAVTLSETPDNAEAFARLAEVFQVDQKPEDVADEAVAVEGEEPEAVEAVDAEPVEGEGSTISSETANKAIRTMARTAHALQHFAAGFKVIADGLETDTLELAQELGVEIPAFAQLPSVEVKELAPEVA